MIDPVPTSGASAAEWPWPIEVDRYDRTPTLYAREVEILNHVLDRSGPRSKCFNGYIQKRLQRLLTPIDDALQAVGATRIARVAISSILVKEMAKRHAPFWGWNEGDWAETICSSASSFSQRQKRGRGYRHDMIAAAYLLGQVRDVRPLGIRSKQKLAAKIFGRQRLREATSTVTDLVLSWGGGPQVCSPPLSPLNGGIDAIPWQPPVG